MPELIEGPLWQKVLAVILIIGFVSWGLYTYVYKPKIKDINEYKKSLQLIEKEIEARKPDEVILAKIRSELKELEKKIPSEAEVPYLLEEFISGVGRNLAISYKLIQPGSLVAEGKYKKVPIKVDYESDYGDLNLYLMQTENLPAIIRTDELTITKAAEPTLSVTMLLSAFVLPGVKRAEGKEEEGAVKKEIAYTFVTDPFFPKKPEVSLPKEIKGIGPWDLQFKGVWRGRKVKALIDDQVLGKGESIKGYKIVDIRDSRVVISKGKKTYTLRLEGK